MIGLDTNVLVRFLVQDDPGQSQRANALMATLPPETPGYVSTTALVETYWLLTRAYKRDKDDVIDVLGELVDNGSIVTQDHDMAVRALGLTADGADFAVAVIAESCRRAGCASVASFDACRQSTGLHRALSAHPGVHDWQERELRGRE